MAEKKDETKTVPEVTYTVDEYVENPQVLKKQRRAQQRNL